MRSFVVLCLVVLTGCAQNGYREFYHPNFDRHSIPPEQTRDFQYLGQDETPQVFSTDNMERDVKVARSRYWFPIGYSSFNGEMGTQDQVVSHAKSIGASMVLVTSKFTENRSITTPLFLPNNQTTYYSGTTNGQYSGDFNANYNANTTGTSTTYGTRVVPITRNQARYDQAAVYFIRYTKKLRIGLNVVPLTPELRTKYERNTGALVELVFENTPAFNGNIMPGDIITEINGKPVENNVQAMSLMGGIQPNSQASFKVLRNGTEKTLNVQVGP